MTKVRIKHVDAFTLTPQTGNPAGVVLEGKNLSERQMAGVARELGLSETAFFLPSSKPGADIKMRWFTPNGEAHWCGHAAIAGAHCLAEEGLQGTARKGKHLLQVDTSFGLIPVEITRHESHTSVMMEVKPRELQKATQYKIDLLSLLNINRSDFDNRFTIARNDCLFVAVRRLHTLFTMKPGIIGIAQFLAVRDLRGICVFTTETVDRDSVVHSRFFAPHLGVNEDPATCSTHSSLGLLFYEYGLIKMRDGLCIFQGEQGDVIGRRGRITVELQAAGEEQKPATVRVGGNAVTVMEGEMIIND